MEWLWFKFKTLGGCIECKVPNSMGVLFGLRKCVGMMRKNLILRTHPLPSSTPLLKLCQNVKEKLYLYLKSRFKAHQLPHSTPHHILLHNLPCGDLFALFCFQYNPIKSIHIWTNAHNQQICKTNVFFCKHKRKLFFCLIVKHRFF